MTKKTLYLHIGRHKSGTSSLQVFLHRNRNALKKDKICYPMTGSKNGIAHHYLANTLNKESKKRKLDYDGLKNDFEKEVEKYPIVIVSSEAFQNIRDKALVVEFFQNYNIITICYLREVLDYAQSAYAQKVQASEFYSSFLFFAQHFNPKYTNFIKSWKNVSDKIFVKYFDRKFLKNNDLINDISDIIGLDMSKYKKNASQLNPSIGGNLLTYKLTINTLGLHLINDYQKYSAIASKYKRWHSGFYISVQNQQLLRNLPAYQKSNKELLKNCRTLVNKDFSHRPVLRSNLFIQDFFTIANEIGHDIQFKNMLVSPIIHNNETIR